MMIRPTTQQNIHPVKATTQAGNPANVSVTQEHFDAALLQAAKAIQDSEPESQLETLSPKVQQALEAALAQMNQMPLAQLQKLSQQPQVLSALAANIAQTNGLTKAQTAQLTELLPLAVPRLLAQKSAGTVPGNNDGTRYVGVQPGPQGGTPAKSASPADFFGNGNVKGRTAPANAAGGSIQQTSTTQQGSAFAVAAGTGASGQGAQAQVQAFPLNAATTGSAPQQSGPASAPVRVIPVSLNASLSQNSGQGSQIQGANPAQAGTAAFLGPQSPSLQSANAAGAQPSGASAALNSGSNAGTQGQANVGTQNQANAGTQNQANAGTQNQANAAGTGQAQTGTSAGVQAPEGLDVEILGETSAPLAIQADSQVTLKGDGSWVFPQGAPAQAKAPAPVPAQNAAQAPASEGTPAPLPGAAQVQGAGTQVTPQASVVQAPVNAPAQGARSAAEGEEGAVEAALEDGQSVSEEIRATPATAESGQAEDQPQAAGSAGQQTAQLAAAQDPGFLQALQGQGGAATQRSNNAAPGVQASALSASDQNAQSALALAQGLQAARAAQGNGFSAALAAVGQDSGNGQSGQTAVPSTVSQQVQNALDAAGAANPGRLLIQLKPASLGEVQVDLILADGKLTARLVTSQTDVRDALVRDLPGFKAGLESHGVTVNEVSVAVRAGVQDQRQGASQQDSRNDWRGPAREASTAAPIQSQAGAYAYTGGPSGAEQGFNALA